MYDIRKIMKAAWRRYHGRTNGAFDRARFNLYLAAEWSFAKARTA